jgi:hypothetical protein
MKQTLKVNQGGSRIVEPEEKKTPAKPTKAAETTEDNEVKKDAD